MRTKIISYVICTLIIITTFAVADPSNINLNTGTSSRVNYQIGFKNRNESIIWSDWASDGNIANVTGSFLRPPTTIYIKIEAPSCNIHYQVGFRNRLEDIIWSDWASNGKDANVTFDNLRPPSSWYLKVESPNFNVTYQIGFKNRLEDIIWSDWVSDGNIANATFNFLRLPLILYMKIKMLGPISAMIDIDPNTLNLKSKGRWITCYITLNSLYDVNDIDISTILLEDTISAEWGDIQSDTLMVKFDRSEVEDMLSPGTYNLKVIGELTDGTKFEGYSDEIRVINPGK